MSNRIAGRINLIHRQEKYKKLIDKKSGGSNYTNMNARLNFGSNLPQLYAGASNRMDRYRMFDTMLSDSTVNTGLNVLSDFISQHPENDAPLRIKHSNTDDGVIQALEIYFKQWAELNDLTTKMFDYVKKFLMYGDLFFVRDPETHELLYIDPYDVQEVVVNSAKGKHVEVYRIRDFNLNLESKNIQSTFMKNNTTYTNVAITPSVAQAGTSTLDSRTANGKTAICIDVDAKHVVHISTNTLGDGDWPFGPSVLEPIYKIYKQKELLEDSAVIYRIQRAPERRVFKVFVGDLPPQRAMAFVEQFRNNIYQRRVPSRNNQGDSARFNMTDAVYNPLSMLDDYYFPVGTENKGSSVEVLPGGQNLDFISEIVYFDNKEIRGLDIPSSYIPTQKDEGTAKYNSGKLGEILVQEVRFALKCRRFQKILAKGFDEDFKHYLNFVGYNIDTSTFKLEFSDMMNFEKWVRLELQSTQVNQYTQLHDLRELSAQFKMKKYLGLTEQEIAENEQNWRDENAEILKKMNLSFDKPTNEDQTAPGLSSVGIPEVSMDEINALADSTSGGASGGEMSSDFGGEPGPDTGDEAGMEDTEA